MMAQYLVQVAYTPEAWASLLQNPQNRIQAIAPVVERLGGKVQGLWLTFGEYDSILITQMPDRVSAAAFSMAISAGGAVKACTTTPLVTAEEGMEAMRKAAGAGYSPPAG
jgi:uncharacterized protein with GYD domain